MTFIAINKQNVFEPSLQVEFRTFEEAESVVKEILVKYPSAEVTIAQVLKKYTAQVVITGTDVVVDDKPETVSEQE